MNIDLKISMNSLTANFSCTNRVMTVTNSWERVVKEKYTVLFETGVNTSCSSKKNAYIFNTTLHNKIANIEKELCDYLKFFLQQKILLFQRNLILLVYIFDLYSNTG